jgi:hypothetical protein
MKASVNTADFLTRLSTGLVVVLALPNLATAQNAPSSLPVDASPMTWPRYEATNGLEFAIYQPQISDWTGNLLMARAVVAVRPAGGGSENYGVIFFTAQTDVDKINRLVTFQNIRLNRANFPTQPDQQQSYLASLQSLQNKTLRVVPLDQLEAVYAASSDLGKIKTQTVENDPPRLIYTTKPSLLILVDGAPVLQPLIGDYQRVINTRAIMLQDTNALYDSYYLYAASNWYTAPSLEGPWSMTGSPPPDIGTALNAALATGQVDPLNPKNPTATTTQFVIYVSLTPAELIETAGAGQLINIPGTSLLYVSNSSKALFYDQGDSNYYVLISGRWFKARTVYGPWTFVPAGALPADFQNIPPDSEKANVLCSVPGTPQAQEAVIANSIPQTATIQRDQAHLTVNYSGTPNFVPIPGTSLSYANNTPTPVVMVDAQTYYACDAGVWFTANSPGGPWAVATSVPPAIYTIPTSCPINYVTYAYTYGSSNNVVYDGYTAGYNGTVVSDGGTVVYGTGYTYPTVTYGTTWYGYPVTYGYGAAMALNNGAGFAYGFTAGISSGCAVEPYWGAYRYTAPAGYGYSWVNVNATSCYSHWGAAASTATVSGYNAYTGASGAASRGAAYNPYTSNAAAGREAAGYNPTTGRYGATEQGVAGNAYSGQTASYNRGVVGNANTGNAVAWNNGNMYADQNGNIYRYSPSTGTQTYNNGTWSSPSQQVQHDTSPAAQPATSYQTPAQTSWVNREYTAQATGEQRYNNYAGSGGGWGGYHGGYHR